MEGGYRIIYIAIALLIFASFVTIAVNVSKTEKQDFRNLSEDTSDVFIMRNGVIQSNFDEVVSGSELKYALLHAKDISFKIDNVIVTDSNRSIFYNNIRNTDVFNASLNTGVWEFNLDSSKSHRINDETLISEVLEETVESESIQNTVNAEILKEEVEELDLEKTYTYIELENIIKNANSNTEFLFSGVFGNFSCQNSDISNLQYVISALNLNQYSKIFQIDNSSIGDLQQVSITLSSEAVSCDSILEIYSNNLIYGNNLIKLLGNGVQKSCYFEDNGSEVLITDSVAYKLDRTAIYCVYEGEDSIIIKDSKLMQGVQLEGTYWLKWRESCNKSWSYNLAVENSIIYQVTSCKYDPIGRLIQIDLEPVME